MYRHVDGKRDKYLKFEVSYGSSLPQLNQRKPFLIFTYQKFIGIDCP